MAGVNYKVLGQQAPAANALVQLYGVTGTRMAVGSTLTICNSSETASLKYTIEVSADGAASAKAHKIFSNVTLPPNGTDALTLGWALQSGSVVRVKASTADASFTLFGQELSQ